MTLVSLLFDLVIHMRVVAVSCDAIIVVVVWCVVDVAGVGGADGVIVVIVCDVISYAVVGVVDSGVAVVVVSC